MADRHADLAAVLAQLEGQHEAVAEALAQLDGLLFVLQVSAHHNELVAAQAGDQIAVMQTRLQARLHDGDLVARLGGDEFIVMCAYLQHEQQAIELSQRLCDSFVLPFQLGKHSCQVGVTVGHALAPRDGLDARSLIKRADAAMYRGKQGRDLAPAPSNAGQSL